MLWPFVSRARLEEVEAQLEDAKRDRDAWRDACREFLVPTKPVAAEAAEESKPPRSQVRTMATFENIERQANTQAAAGNIKFPVHSVVNPKKS